MKRYRVAFHIPAAKEMDYRPPRYETFVGPIHDQYGIVSTDGGFWDSAVMGENGQTDLEPVWVTRWREQSHTTHVLVTNLMRPR